MRTMETCFLANEQIFLENLVRCKWNQPDLPYLLERLALSKFETLWLESVKTLITSAPSKSCEIDPLPTTIAEECLNELSPAISSMINLSLEQGQLSDVLKGAPIHTSSKNIQKLQLIQNFACKIICGARKYDHVTPLLDELNWLPVSKMLKFRDAVMAYKCASNLAPEYLCAKFKKRSSVHNRTTRNNEKFEIPLFRSATGQRTFAYRAVSLWNTLDEDLRNATTVKAFKKALKLVMNEWLYDS